MARRSSSSRRPIEAGFVSWHTLLVGTLPPMRRRRQTSRRLLERLEERLALSVSNFPVSNTNSSGPGSLPAEVALANAATNVALITFEASVFTTAKTITLAQTLTLNNTHSGVSIEIEGPAAGVTIAGGGSSSDFGVMTVSSGTTVILTGASSAAPLIVADGNQQSPGENGAGIDNSGNLVLSHAEVIENVSGLGEGGGIENDTRARLLVSDSTIAANVAGGTGGGLNNLGTATLADSIIANNELNSDGASGAGIENVGTLNVFNSAVFGNTTGNGGFQGGGALDNLLGTATVVDSTFANNITNSTGGAINNGAANLAVIDCTIFHNAAFSEAGGIENNNGGSLTLLSSIVTGNIVGPGHTDDDVDLSAQTQANHDLIGDSHGVQGAGLVDGKNGNIIGHAALLAPFGSYGGGTDTLALLPGSPALQTGGAMASLSANVTSSATTINVTALFTPPSPVLGQGYDILIGGEQMLVTAVSGSGTKFTLTVKRGDHGTTAATHSSGAGIFLPQDQRGVAMPPAGSTDIGAFQSRGFNVTVNSGDSPQSTPVSTAFAKPLAVTVTANDPNVPVNGGIITYTVHAGSHGGSATLTSTKATISGGQASVKATANGKADSYVVDASAVAGSAATFHLTNTPLSTKSVTLAATEGATFSGKVATFTDANSAENAAADFTATIVWGDGATSAGKITTVATGGFAVTGSHVYAEEGTHAVTVTVADNLGNHGTASSTAKIADAALKATAHTFTATEGKAFSGTVATVTDADPKGALGDYKATIVWGDGTTTAGTVTTLAGGGFAITGSHTYAATGTDTVKVTIADSGGSKVTADSTAKVSSASSVAAKDAVFSQLGG